MALKELADWAGRKGRTNWNWKNFSHGGVASMLVRQFGDDVLLLEEGEEFGTVAPDVLNNLAWDGLHNLLLGPSAGAEPLLLVCLELNHGHKVVVAKEAQPVEVNAVVGPLGVEVNALCFKQGKIVCKHEG